MLNEVFKIWMNGDVHASWVTLYIVALSVITRPSDSSSYKINIIFNMHIYIGTSRLYQQSIKQRHQSVRPVRASQNCQTQKDILQRSPSRGRHLLYYIQAYLHCILTLWQRSPNGGPRTSFIRFTDKEKKLKPSILIIF